MILQKESCITTPLSIVITDPLSITSMILSNAVNISLCFRSVIVAKAIIPPQTNQLFLLSSKLRKSLQ